MSFPTAITVGLVSKCPIISASELGLFSKPLSWCISSFCRTHLQPRQWTVFVCRGKRGLSMGAYRFIERRAIHWIPIVAVWLLLGRCWQLRSSQGSFKLLPGQPKTVSCCHERVRRSIVRNGFTKIVSVSEQPYEARWCSSVWILIVIRHEDTEYLCSMRSSTSVWAYPKKSQALFIVWLCHIQMIATAFRRPMVHDWRWSRSTFL